MFLISINILYLVIFTSQVADMYGTFLWGTTGNIKSIVIWLKNVHYW